ncbi:hypothetical protein [Paraburkholderia tropica]|uniref:hypothetical protein n=1 Tax=Paraburkholderia tropica TaxID=92647 RepID=UPI002AB048B1|nr:hypothetical protein [Paraburkholderia tropica]
MRNPAYPLFRKRSVAVPLLAALCANSASAAPYVWLTTNGANAQARVSGLLPEASHTTAVMPTLQTPHAVLADGNVLICSRN